MEYQKGLHSMTSMNIVDRYAARQLGPNFYAVLQVAEKIAQSGTPQIVKDRFAEFGGVETARNVVKDSVSSSRWDATSQTLTTVLKCWRSAAGLPSRDPAKMMAAGGGQSKSEVIKQFMSMMSGGKGSPLGGDDNARDMAKLKDVKQRLDNATSEYERNMYQREFDDLNKKLTDTMTSNLAGKAEKDDAWELCARIMSMGVTESDTPGFQQLYQAVAQG